MTVMDQPVDNSTGDHFIKEDSVPFTELKIGSNDHAPFLIAVGYDLKEEYYPFPIEWDILSIEWFCGESLHLIF